MSNGNGNETPRCWYEYEDVHKAKAKAVQFDACYVVSSFI
jgi:hypothetical protein